MFIWLYRIGLFSFLYFLFPPGEIVKKYGKLKIILWQKSSTETAERTFEDSLIDFKVSFQNISLLFIDPMVSHFVAKNPITREDFIIYIFAIVIVFGLSFYLINYTEFRSQGEVRIKIYDYVIMEYMSKILLNKEDSFETISAKMDYEMFIDEKYGKFPKSIL